MQGTIEVTMFTRVDARKRGVQKGISENDVVGYLI